MKKRKSLMAGILSGLAPAWVQEKPNYPRLQGSDLSRMRSDVERVGRDFSSVMSRENEKAQHAGATAEADSDR